MKKNPPVILRNAGGDAPSFWFYDEFGPDDYGLISANAVREALANLGNTRKLDVHYNSQGGDIYEASAIYNLLKNCGAKITSFIDGMAVSCASWVAQSGDDIRMAENALLMIHDPETDCYGNAADMSKSAALLDTVKQSILSVYAKRTTKMTSDELSAAMSAETWYTAPQALEAGLIDSIDANKSIDNQVITMRGDARRFRNAPDWLRQVMPGSDDHRKVLNERKQLLNELELTL